MPGPAGAYVVEQKERYNKNDTFVTSYFCVELCSGRLLGNSVSLADHKTALKKERWVLNFSVLSVVELYIRLLYCASTPILHRESTDFMIVLPVV